MEAKLTKEIKRKFPLDIPSVVIFFTGNENNFEKDENGYNWMPTKLCSEKDKRNKLDGLSK